MLLVQWFDADDEYVIEYHEFVSTAPSTTVKI